MSRTVEELLADIKNTLDNIANEINPCFTREYIGLDETLAELVSVVRADERQQLVATAVIQFPMGDGKYIMIRLSVLDLKEMANG